MNLKTLYATIVGFIVYFFLSWLIFGILLMDYYTANTIAYEGLMNEMPQMGYLIVGALVWTFLLVFIFQKWANIKTFASGFWGGMIITFLVLLSYDLYFLAGFNLYHPKLMVVDVIVGSILGGIVGAVIGWMLGLGKNKKYTAEERAD